MRRPTRGGNRWPLPVLLAIALVTAVTAATVVALVSHRTAPRAKPGSAAGQPAQRPSRAPASAGPGGQPVNDEQRRVDACVAAVVSRLTPEAMAGQLLMVGTPVADPASLSATVGRYGLGGVFLAGRSTQPAATLRQGIQALQQRAATSDAGVALHIAVDQEGGQVQTLKGADFPLIPSAVEQGRWDAATLRARTSDWARRLAAVGVTMDLAPVADTVPAGTADQNPPIGAFDRQFGATPDAVAQDIAAVVPAVQAAGVLTTLKHFPGLGRVRANTDTSTRAVDDVTTVDDPFLRPFASGIAAGSAAVMISSARYPKLDADNIAAFSAPVVTGLLRQRLGYTGLVISDDLGAATAASAVPVGERAVRFVRAGGDMVLTVRAADAAPMVNALVAAGRGDPAFQARLADAARHVVASKYRAGLLKC
jgi:beta-N-acetylhexosaminidase